LVLTEFRAINPHPVEQDGEFARDSHNGATTTLGAHLSHWRRVATRYDRSPTVFLSAIALAATVIFWL
jgi:transposase